MNLDQLRYVLEVHRTKNFSRAAENCKISQPSLSVQIAKLEEELDIPLFERGRTGVSTTEYGKEIIKQIRNIVDEVERLQDLAKDLKGETRGEFRLGIIPTLAPTVLPKFLKIFAQRYPEVTLTVSEETTDRIVKDLDQGLLDGAILSTPSKSPDSLMEKLLFYEPFVVFASKGHSILRHEVLHSDLLSSNEVLLLDDAHCLRDQSLQICKAKAETKDTNGKLRIKSGGLPTLIEYLRENSGYTLLPSLASALLSSGERDQNIRHFAKPLPTRKVSLVFHNAHLKRSLLEAIHSVLLESVGNRVLVSGSRSEIKVLSPDASHFKI